MISKDLKKKLLRGMLRLRLIEERLAAIYHQADEIKTPMHLYTGQEAVAVGVCAALRPEDTVSPYHRSHGWYIAKGGNLCAMMAELMGKEAGCCKGWGGSMHLLDVSAGVMGSSSILAGTVPHAVGAALAFQIKGEDRVAIAPAGDAAIEEGVFHESLNWASLKKLPVVFICENNLYSTSTHLRDRQPSVDIFKRAEAYGMPGSRCDGNDVGDVYTKTLEAVNRARRLEGPSFIEVMTYRWREHVGPNYDWDLGYRTKQEGEEWMIRCPIKALAAEFPAAQVQSYTDEFEKEIDEALVFARQAAFPREETIRV
ncbi:MAG: thiamine pyrophosphate-dependent dehydrogenase E1 component subunit alpha [Candidatus Omnitrophica bacterium]|nr:thiamine pyrophosphate-dependent dehydrogenase E1 component subunit alpha [Candidatus Omnitrophota bacterium]